MLVGNTTAKQSKTEYIAARVSTHKKLALTQLCDSLGLSVTEAIEQLVDRALVEHSQPVTNTSKVFPRIAE